MKRTDLVLLTAYVEKESYRRFKGRAKTIGTSCSKLIESGLRKVLDLEGRTTVVMVERNGMQIPTFQVTIDPVLKSSIERASEVLGIPPDLVVNDLLTRALMEQFPANGKPKRKAVLQVKRRAP
jgi:hypothetical protein